MSALLSDSLHHAANTEQPHLACTACKPALLRFSPSGHSTAPFSCPLPPCLCPLSLSPALPPVPRKDQILAEPTCSHRDHGPLGDPPPVPPRMSQGRTEGQRRQPGAAQDHPGDPTPARSTPQPPRQPILCSSSWGPCPALRPVDPGREGGMGLGGQAGPAARGRGRGPPGVRGERVQRRGVAPAAGWDLDPSSTRRAATVARRGLCSTAEDPGEALPAASAAPGAPVWVLSNGQNRQRDQKGRWCWAHPGQG